LNINELIIKNTRDYFAEFPAKFQHHWVVSAVGGARGDFVANWIGSIQSHFNSNISNWFIDDRGASKASTKLFDYGHVCPGPTPVVEPKLLEQLTAHFDPTARQSVSKTHDDYSALHAVIPAQHHDKFTMLEIVYDVQDREQRIKILWEMLCKTFFINGLNNIDQTITQAINEFYPDNNVALEVLVNKMCKANVEHFVQWGRRPVDSVGSLRRVVCDYSKITTVDGSRHLEQLLEIDIAPEYHELYAQRLATADSPDVIEFRGREWSRAELLSWAD